MTDFENLVKQMRQAQRDYFANKWHDVKGREYLNKSKKLEKQVDQYFIDKESKQTNLF